MRNKFSFKEAIEHISLNYAVRDYVGQLCGAPTKFSREQAWFLCPLHNEKTASFVVRTSQNKWHCFGCNKGGNLFDLYMEYNGTDFYGTVISLANSMNIEIEHNQADFDLSLIYGLLKAYIAAGDSCGISANNRRLNDTLVRKYGVINAHQKLPAEDLSKIGLINDRGNFIMRDRYVFPIYNHHRIICGLIGERTKSEQEPKYLFSLNTPAFEKRTQLWGLHLLNKPSYVICVEGIYDAIKLNALNLNAVATLGTAISREQIKKLNDNTQNVILLFDNDEAGKKAIWNFVLRYMETNSVYFKVYVPHYGLKVDHLLKKDADEMSFIELKTILTRCSILEDYICRYLVDAFGEDYQAMYNYMDNTLFTLSDSKALHYKMVVLYRLSLPPMPLMKVYAEEYFRNFLFQTYRSVNSYAKKTPEHRSFMKRYEGLYGDVWKLSIIKINSKSVRFEAAYAIIKPLHFLSSFRGRYGKRWSYLNNRIIDLLSFYTF